MSLKLVSAIVVAVLASGCAGKRVSAVTPEDRPTTVAAVAAAPADDSLETYIQKFRKVAAEARPVRPQLTTLEAHDRELSTALAAAILEPSPDSFRRVAGEYRRLGVFDRAFQFLGRALALEPHDGATFDALARLWRDSGLAGLALGDAHRAVFFAPDSAVTHNTLGTVLQALGRKELARAEYERALRLDPSAAFALNNLCYGWVLDGARPQAVDACLRAIEIQPGLTAARNNLALAYALDGDVAAATSAFAEAGDAASAHYNTGIMYLARREYSLAVRAFQQALVLRPDMRVAQARVRQAAAAAARVGE